LTFVHVACEDHRRVTSRGNFVPQFNVVRSASTAVFSSIESLEPRRLLSGGPRVIYSSLRDGAEVFDDISSVFVRFDRPIRSVGSSDFRFSPAGSPGTSVGNPTWSFEHDATEGQIQLNGLARGPTR
jgi:hypothetical protein